MDTASSLLSKVLKKRGLHKHAQASLITHEAQKWIAEHLPNFVEKITVLSIKDGCLQIACTHSIAAQELHAVCEELQSFLEQKDDSLKPEGIRILRK